MRVWLLLAVALPLFARTGEDDPAQMLQRVRRIYVDKLAGGDSAAQIRDMLINGLQGSKRFIVTESLERADAVLRGSAEDLIFTDTFQTSEGVTARGSLGVNNTDRASSSSYNRRGLAGSVSVGEHESTRIAERKHEAMAAVRLVSKDGDVIWSTTQESLGAKFRGASADVAYKVVQQLLEDLEKLVKPAPGPQPTDESAPSSGWKLPR